MHVRVRDSILRHGFGVEWQRTQGKRWRPMQIQGWGGNGPVGWGGKGNGKATATMAHPSVRRRRHQRGLNREGRDRGRESASGGYARKKLSFTGYMGLGTCSRTLDRCFQDSHVSGLTYWLSETYRVWVGFSHIFIDKLL